MVPPILKELFVPGSTFFFLIVATLGTLLLYRSSRAGRVVLTALVVFYWVLSTPITAIPLVRALSPDYPHVKTREDAPGATAIVVLGGGMETYRSRDGALQSGSREHSLRALEAVRVYRVLDRPWVIVTGSLAPETITEAAAMATTLKLLGVPEDRIVQEGKSRNTQDHAIHVPPLLTERGVKQFVLVTSRQHMARSLRAFRQGGWEPIPSSPEFFLPRGVPFEPFLPSKSALDASTAMMYDVAAILYYRSKEWMNRNKGSEASD